MSTSAPSTAAITALPADTRAVGWLGPFLELTKFRLSLLVLWTTATGYVLAAHDVAGPHAARFLWTLLGTALAAFSANAFNQIIEIRRDAVMERTRERPLPAGVITRRQALVTASALAVLGVGLLWILVGPLPALLAALTIGIYVGVYTPLKTRSTLNTLVGAVCGGLPPMIGWAGASGNLSGGAWVLGGLLFVWQLPHFLALAWMYRDDYARGGYMMLPNVDPDGRLTARIVLLTSLMLIPISLSVTMLGLGGVVYTIGALGLGAWMVVGSIRLVRNVTRPNARAVFLASLFYLSLILVLLVINRGPIGATA